MASYVLQHIDDCLRSVGEFMELPASALLQRTYNITGESFTPRELAEEIRKTIPHFEMEYLPDHRQAIAESWPEVLDDTMARRDWNWIPMYDTKKMCQSMMKDLAPLYPQPIDNNYTHDSATTESISAAVA